MERIEELKQILKNHKEQFPQSKRYPKAFWQQVIPLAQEIGTQTVAAELQIDLCHLTRKVKKAMGAEGVLAPSFVEAPLSLNSRKITLQLPHGIILRIEQ